MCYIAAGRLRNNIYVYYLYHVYINVYTRIYPTEGWDTISIEWVYT